MIGHYHNTFYFCSLIFLWYLIHCLIHHFSRCITSHLTFLHLTKQMSTIMDIHSDKVVPLGSVIKTLPTDIFSIWHRRLHIFSVWGTLSVLAGVHGGTQTGVHGGTKAGVHGGTPLRTCVAKTACASLCVRQLLYLNNFRLLMSGDNHLGDTLAVVDDEVLLREVDEDDANLTAVVGINGAGRVEHRDTLLQRQSATRTHLCFIAGRQLHEKACLHQSALEGFEDDRAVGKKSSEVHACRLGCLIFGQRVMAGVYKLNLHG